MFTIFFCLSLTIYDYVFHISMFCIFFFYQECHISPRAQEILCCFVSWNIFLTTFFVFVLQKYWNYTKDRSEHGIPLKFIWLCKWKLINTSSTIGNVRNLSESFDIKTSFMKEALLLYDSSNRSASVYWGWPNTGGSSYLAHALTTRFT